MSNFTELLRSIAENGDNEPDATLRAADIIDELEAALQWFIDNDETNEGDEPMEEYGGRTWDQLNEYWIDGLNRGRNALSRLRSL